jgi:hypothetical protein
MAETRLDARLVEPRRPRGHQVGEGSDQAAPDEERLTDYERVTWRDERKRESSHRCQI